MATIGLAMIVKNAEKTLDVCLQSVDGLFDQIVIVDTGSSDSTKAIASKYTSEVYDFEWVYDFSAARNFSFSKLRTTHAFWLDSDDMLVGREHFEEMVEKALNQDVEAVVLEYYYSFTPAGERVVDTLEHQFLAGSVSLADAAPHLRKVCNTTQWRERLIKLQPDWKWLYPIHEALPAGGRRIAKFDKVKILHRRHRLGPVASTQRNLEILNRVPQHLRDQRIWFYYGLEYASLGMLDDSIAAFQAFLPLSTIEDEKYLAFHYLGDLYRAKQDHDRAIDYELRAVHLRPSWRDAYAGLLASAVACEQWEKALHYGEMAKAAAIPDTPFAYNPIHEEVGWVPDYAMALTKTGRLEDALEECRRSLQLVPNDPAMLQNVDTLSIQINLKNGKEVLSNAVEFFLRHDDAESAAMLLARFPQELIDDTVRSWIQACGFVCGNAANGIVVPDQLTIPPGAVIPNQAENNAPWWHDPRVQHLRKHLAKRPHIERVLQVGGPPELARVWSELGIVAAHSSSATSIPGLWDAVVFFGALERVKYPKQLVDLARAAVTPGGEIIAVVPNGPARKGLAPPDYSHVRLRAFNVDTFRQTMGTIRMPELTDAWPAEAGAMFLFDPQPVHARPKTIAIVAVGAPEPWGPDSLRTGIGGSEEAVVRLSRAFARRGHSVTVYGSGWVGEDERGDTSEWPKYKDIKDYVAADVLIGWRHPALFLNQLRPFEAEWKALWLHDSQDKETVKAAAQNVDCVWCISDYHANLYSDIPNVYVGRNGIDPNDFPMFGEVDRNPAKIVYVSTPFRGLDLLLEMFPQIRAAVPEAELHAYYGWESADKMGATLTPDGRAFKERVMSLATSIGGVHWHGRVGQAELYREVASAGVWAYPTRWYEEHCISAYIAQACGAWPVVYPRGALQQSVLYGHKVEPPAFVESVVKAIRDDSPREPMMEWFRKNTSWDNVAAMWERLWMGMTA